MQADVDQSKQVSENNKNKKEASPFYFMLASYMFNSEMFYLKVKVSHMEYHRGQLSDLYCSYSFIMTSHRV